VLYNCIGNSKEPIIILKGGLVIFQQQNILPKKAIYKYMVEEDYVILQIVEFKVHIPISNTKIIITPQSLLEFIILVTLLDQFTSK